MKPAALILAAVTAATGPFLMQDKAPKPPKVGEPAPAFRLNDHTGKSVTVGGESEEWTVLAFYPKAGTPG